MSLFNFDQYLLYELQKITDINDKDLYKIHINLNIYNN